MRAGSIRLYLRGKTWWCWGQGPDGKRWLASTHQKDRVAAERAARVIERDRAAAVHVAPGPTVADSVRALRAAMVRGDRSLHTGAFYERKMGHIVRLVGPDRDLSTLTAKHLEQYTDTRLGEGAGRSTTAKELGALRTAARRVGVVLPPMPPELRGAYVPRTRWLPVREYQALIAALPAARRRYVEAWCVTGMRESELYGIDPARDITPEGILVRGTKTAGSRRVLPPTETLQKLLAEPFAPWPNVRRDLRIACTHAGIAPVSPNDLRRTFASWLAQGNVPLIQAIRLLGHGSAAMLSKVYAQLAPESARAAMDAVTDVVANAGLPGALSARGARPDPAKKAEKLVPRDGIEPPTRGFSIPCSTN